MLTIEKMIEGNRTTFALEGKLDTITSPDLNAQIKECLDYVQELVLDFTQLKYISSAGLRVLLETQQNLPEGGELKITNVDPVIQDILDVTGFSEILTIE